MSIMVANDEAGPVALNVKHPELLVEHFYVSGSLDYVVKLCNLERKINYVVTVLQNEGPRRNLNCNIVSKCSLNFDSLSFHITLPLLIVVRHTTQSLRHVKDLLVDVEVNIPLVKKYEDETVTCDKRSNMTEFTSYLCALERTALSSCQTNFGEVSEQFETCNNPEKRSSEVHVDILDLSQSSLMSEHLDSPVEVPANCHLLSSSSPYDADVVEDTTDSPQFLSSDPEAPVQSSMATYGASKSTLKMSSNDVVENDHLDLSISPSIKDMLNIDESNLDFSIFGSVKVSNIQVYVGIESLLVLCEMHEISGAVDCRTVSPKNWQSHPHVPLSYKVLPSYFSLASTLKKFVLSAQDHAISNNDLGNLTSENLEFCASICYLKEYVAPAYRCLVRFPGILLDMKQPPIVLHKKLNKYIPTFSAIYEDVFASSPDSFVDDAEFVGTTPAVSVAELQFPPHIPKGSALFFLKKFKIIVRPLPSLMVSYDIAPVVAQIGSTTIIKLMLSIGQHKLEFNSKEHKDDLSLRPIPLPVVLLKGKITPRLHSRLPSVTLEISVKQVVIEVTTNVLNQLLILQTAFIKETNELFNMFMNIGESIPQDRLNAINLAEPADTGFELISLLNLVKLSMQGVKITVSTPLLTAVRFSTGNKIEMLITNVSHQHDSHTSNKSHLTLHGKVETEINIALGCIQGGQNVEEEEDDFVELAYFKTWIAFKNTLQQNTSKTDLPVMSDIFLISIYSPHLYIQSTAVEKAILFWVNCKSVYNFWQNEHHQLNTEVQAATEAFVDRLTKPAVQIKAPSIDFSKPRLVQITVSDVGACMPLVHLQTTPHASQKGFPAVVLTIKEMYVSLNFSKKLVSAGRFTGFLVRFDEQFHFRHKTWTVDPKKHKFLNHGIVPSGTYKLCIVNKNDFKEDEKLFTAFKWHMSGINVYASTDIGRHISTLVRTLTIIGSDLEEADSEVISAPGESKPLHKRAFSVSSKTFVDEQETLRAMEWDLAKQTRKLNKMRQTGVAPDNLKYEEDTFHKIEMDLVRGLRRVFRKGKGFSFQQIGQILSPRSAGLSGHNKKPVSPSSTLPRNRLASVTETETEKLTASLRSHSRHRSDISPTVLRLIKLNESVSSDALPVVEEELSSVADVACSASEHVESEPLIPSVNIEINVTISVDSGSIVLQNEDVKSREHRGPVSHFSSDSPFLSSTRKDKVKSSIDTVLLIPALLVKAHYQNFIGHSFVSAHLSPSKRKYDHVLNENHWKTSPDDSTTHNNSFKKGILLISTIISPLPHDLELHPSLLDFVEQVVRPINLNIIPQKSETDDEDDEDSLAKESSLVTSQSSVHSLSFPVDVNITFTIHPSKIYLTCNPHAHVKCLMEIPTVNFAISFSLFERKQFECTCMPADCSVASSITPDDTSILNNLHITGCFKTFALVMYTPSPSVQASTVHDDTSHRGYKEAFNLVLGQAFIHLSRKSVHENVLCKASGNICVQEKLKVSVIPVVESLLLTFDWRRLNDITWFRKCWYHNGLIEALFTGHKPFDDVQQVDGHQSFDLPLQKSGSNEDLNPLYNSSDTVTAEIVVAVSIVDLRVYANMAQFMGNAHLLLSHVHGISHADVHQNKLILLMCNGGIEEIDFTAEGGVVAGDLTMKMLKLHVLTSSQEDAVPEHNILINLSVLQGHIDYMSAHILLLRIVDVCAEACDKWNDISQDDFTPQSSLSIQISAKLKWTTFQLAMHRSTAAAAFGIAQRMYDFVMQQKKRSERTIGLMLPPGTAASTAFAAYQEDQKRAENSSIDSPFMEYHHWMWAVKFGNAALLNVLPSLESYDDCNVSLGGKIDISGDNFCLVCFHGTSFRETEWATLNIDGLGGQFSTKAIPGLGELNEIHNSDVTTRICSQSCKIFLGQNVSKKSELAAIYRVSVGRGGIPPISHKEIAEWLHYACIHHYIHSSKDTSGHGKLFFKQSQKLTIQHVIGFPALNVSIINDHFWPSLDILLKYVNSVKKPLCTVECSVFSSFSESIAVTTTVENYLFLHDLFKGYIDHLEEQKISFRPPFSGIQIQGSELSNENMRKFVNIHWDVEPHILLMGKSTWASGQINPHISWLLEKLGLDHARTTIPMYVQRGLMDPIDLAIATTLEVLLTLSQKKHY